MDVFADLGHILCLYLLPHALPHLGLLVRHAIPTFSLEPYLTTLCHIELFFSDLLLFFPLKKNF
jgi:hypothetical protein